MALKLPSPPPSHWFHASNCALVILPKVWIFLNPGPSKETPLRSRNLSSSSIKLLWFLAFPHAAHTSGYSLTCRVRQTAPLCVCGGRGLPQSRVGQMVAWASLGSLQTGSEMSHCPGLELLVCDLNTEFHGSLVFIRTGINMSSIIVAFHLENGGLCFPAPAPAASDRLRALTLSIIPKLNKRQMTCLLSTWALELGRPGIKPELRHTKQTSFHCASKMLCFYRLKARSSTNK